MTTTDFEKQLMRRKKDIIRIVEYATQQNILAAAECANAGAEQVKGLIDKKGGYKKTEYSWGTHWSSAPGSPPAMGTGHLLNSIVSGVIRKGNPASAYFGSKARYAVPLEFGHKGPKPAAPRPFIRPVANDPSFRSRIRTTVAREWRKSIIIGVANTKDTSFRP
jgi:hypothetical protein